MTVPIRLSWPLLASAGLATVAAADPVNLGFAPGEQTVCVGDIVSIDLVLTTDGPPQDFHAVDAIITWDPAILEFIGNDDSNSDATWLASDFLPDPDGVNDDLTDGMALYTALALPGQAEAVPIAPNAFIVTTFQFEAIAATALTEVDFEASFGVFGRSRVLLNGAEITGDIGAPSTVTDIIPSCPADLNCDENVDALDYLLVIAQWGDPCGGDCVADITGPTPFVPDGIVDSLDFLVVIAQWGSPGNCP
jgi:hypothetical protein